MKGLRGESLRSAVVDFDGMAGDRVLGLFEPGTDDAVWGGGNPRMMAWEAAWPAQCGCGDAVSGDPVLYESGGAAWAVDDAGLPARLAETIDAGKGVELRKVKRDYGRMLVVFEASMRRLSEELGREVEVERFRPNVVVAADLEPYAEAAFEPGTPIRLGGHEFTVQKQCVRCVLPSWTPDGSNVRDKELHRHLVKELDNLFGVYVRIGETARVAVGDPVSG